MTNIPKMCLSIQHPMALKQIKVETKKVETTAVPLGATRGRAIILAHVKMPNFITLKRTFTACYNKMVLASIDSYL